MSTEAVIILWATIGSFFCLVALMWFIEMRDK